MAMFFLERTSRQIGAATGGSTFYIRNRIKDALVGTGEVAPVTVAWDGREVPATEVTLTPFQDDPHRSQLGPFADMEIRVTVSEAVPGWYHSLVAETPPDGAAAPFRAEVDLSGVTR